MTEKQAIAAIAMWQSRRFDTWDIADILGVHEAAVERAIHANRAAGINKGIREAQP